MRTISGKTITGWALITIGVIPCVIWFALVAYMFYIGPRIGWLSDEFINVECRSFLWCAGMFVGVLVGFAGISILEKDRE